MTFNNPDNYNRFSKPKEKNTVPPYQFQSVSRSWLQKNPRYKNVFKECPSCNQLSFVNIDMYARPIVGRKCRKCGYFNDQVDK